MTPPPNYRAIAAAAARKYGVPVDVFLAQIQQESGFRPVATSSAAAHAAAGPARRGVPPMGQNPVTAALGVQAAPPPDPRPQLLRALAATQGPDLTGFYRQLGRARQAQQAQAAHTQSLTIPPTRPEPGMAPRTPTTQAQAQTPGSFAELLHEGVG